MRVQREFRRLTLEQAAEFLGLEVHVYAGLENGTRTLSKRQAIRIARLLAEKGPPSPPESVKPPGAARPPMPETAP